MKGETEPEEKQDNEQGEEQNHRHPFNVRPGAEELPGLTSPKRTTQQRCDPGDCEPGEENQRTQELERRLAAICRCFTLA
jgi:hypothetical protein